MYLFRIQRGQHLVAHHFIAAKASMRYKRYAEVTLYQGLFVLHS